MNSKQARPFVGILVTAILVLGLMGAAVAAVLEGGVLDYFLGKEKPTQEQQDMVEAVGLEHEAEGVKTTVVDTLFDGSSVNVGLTLDTEKQVYVVMDSFTMGGAKLWVSTSNVEDMWVNNPMTGEPFMRARGITGALDEEYLDLEAPEAKAAFDAVIERIQKQGTADVSLHLTLLTPKGKLEACDTFGEDSDAQWKRIDECVSRGSTPIDASEPYNVLVSRAWLGEDDYEGAPAGQHPLSDANAYVEYANMQVLDSFELAFTLTADRSRNIEATPKNDINDGRTHIHFDDISFTPLRSTFELSITPDGMTMEEIQNTFMYFAFFDENRQPLSFQDTGFLCDAGLVEEKDGTQVYRVNYHMPALPSLPSYIRIVPYNMDSSAESPLWEYEIGISTID